MRHVGEVADEPADLVDGVHQPVGVLLRRVRRVGVAEQETAGAQAPVVLTRDGDAARGQVDAGRGEGGDGVTHLGVQAFSQRGDPGVGDRGGHDVTSLSRCAPLRTDLVCYGTAIAL